MTQHFEELNDDPRGRARTPSTASAPVSAAGARGRSILEAAVAPKAAEGTGDLPRWKANLDKLLTRAVEPEGSMIDEVFAEPRVSEVIYLLNLRETRLREHLVVDFYRRDVKPDGERGRLEVLEVDDALIGKLEGEADRRLLRLLLGNSAEDRTRTRLERAPRYSRSAVRPGMYETVLPELCATGRFSCEGGIPDVHPTEPLIWDGREPFAFGLAVSRAEGGWRMMGELRRGDEALDVEQPRILLRDGLFVSGTRVCSFDPGDAADQLMKLRRSGAVPIPYGAQDEFLLYLASIPNLPEVNLPPELHWSQVKVKPRPKVSFSADDTPTEVKHVIARVVFDYGGKPVPVNTGSRFVADEQGRQLFRRDMYLERKALERLRTLGVEAAKGEEVALGEVKIPAKDLPDVIRELLEEEWLVEADGEPIRVAGNLRSKVSSTIDWFDLEAELDFGGVTASLPELLLCAQRGDRFVRLKDGSRGLAPAWLRKYAAAASTGRVEQGRLRFLPSQAGIIDALLTGQGEVTVDVKFDRLQKSLKQGVSGKEVVEPIGFKGKLRDYQKDGLAWLRFLEAHQYGGCLADDMGLGKTVQVLAMLQGRHRPGGVVPPNPSPSLIVVPRSLIYNWINEAKKFTELKALDYTGAERVKHRGELDQYDIIVTTYGTLRTEILHFLDTRFNTLILDEAQAIKNPRSQAAKACRLVRSEHRLAISGTPIENGLDELWSIFEFLNPGMLGSLDEFAAGGKDKDDAWLELLSQALRPFMLRRTKEQVLKELPGKTEKILYVDLDPEERRKYDELRDYYRSSLTSRIGEVGLNRSKIQVLEALLRLRQASCHPGLIDKARQEESSSKIDVLFEMLERVVKTGHKALIFSQFTALLGIVRRRLEAAGIRHEYLDGATRDRQGAVDRFQKDPDNAVFLISLKAGGCGITLTSSDYVFILDPWWNPAVEAQAIDRAHRMGQTRPVFAYRMIARDTVEEKIVALQDEKRRLADMVVSGERHLVKDLDMEDLEKLFS